MSANLMPKLQRQMDFMRAAARAPRAEWDGYARALRDLPVVGADAGDTAMALAATGRSLVKQLPRLHDDAEGPARAMLGALIEILQIEFNARFEPPYYNRGDL